MKNNELIRELDKLQKNASVTVYAVFKESDLEKERGWYRLAGEITEIRLTDDTRCKEVTIEVEPIEKEFPMSVGLFGGDAKEEKKVSELRKSFSEILNKLKDGEIDKDKALMEIFESAKKLRAFSVHDFEKAMKKARLSEFILGEVRKLGLRRRIKVDNRTFYCAGRGIDESAFSWIKRKYSCIKIKAKEFLGRTFAS